MPNRKPMSHAGTNLKCLFWIVAVALGLAAVMAGLAPFAEGLGTAASDRPLIGVARDAESPPPPPIAGHALAQPAAMPMDLATEPAWNVAPCGSVTDSWDLLFYPQHSVTLCSPLYPQHGVTLWDRIRVGAQEDRRAFLMGTAIQVHAAATAATPVPRSAPPRPRLAPAG